MHRIAVALLDLLFPPKCPYCGRVLKNPRAAHCGICADKLPRLDDARGTRHGAYFDVCVSPLAYEGAVRGALLRYKFYGAREYGAPFGAAVAETLRARGIAADAVTWVPLGAKRRRERGYNQAELLARPIAKILSLPAAPYLRRARETAANSGLENAAARAENIRDVFEPVSPELFRGKRILLIDDVVTTGATLSECARTLLRAGADSVACAAFAAAQIGT